MNGNTGTEFEAPDREDELASEAVERALDAETCPAVRELDARCALALLPRGNVCVSHITGAGDGEKLKDGFEASILREGITVGFEICDAPNN